MRALSQAGGNPAWHYVKCGKGIAFLTVVASVSLICFSPIDNKNRLLNQNEKRLYKKIMAVLVIIFLFIDVVFFWCNLHIYSVCIAIGIMLLAVLQIPCIFEKLIKNGVKWPNKGDKCRFAQKGLKLWQKYR